MERARKKAGTKARKTGVSNGTQAVKWLSADKKYILLFYKMHTIHLFPVEVFKVPVSLPVSCMVHSAEDLKTVRFNILLIFLAFWYLPINRNLR